ncbi:MAG: acyl carrier protein [Clostridia bacterium]|nr:acyl carrier protein [Clostridia bacterium]MBR5949528.1 acyl carrier protein [Clostridia bacterium]
MFEEIRKAIAQQLNIPEERITEDSRLIDDLKADSLDVVELVMGLEERYGIEIPDEDLPSIKTVGDIIRYIESK